MVKSIQELYDKLERREDKRCASGRDFNGVHVLLLNALCFIKENPSDIYMDYMLSKKEFCTGFLYGLLSSHCITKEEFKVLEGEVMSSYSAYLLGCAQEAAERNGDLPEDFDLMSLEGGVAL